ncbi:MAG: 1-acyl-sn-glycerol-3-phosphate acyltransferase [Spirochaetia bacterium]
MTGVRETTYDFRVTTQSNSEKKLLTVKERFADYLPTFLEKSKVASAVSHDSVFQQANPATRELVNRIVDSLMLPGSRLIGFEHLKELAERSRAGESCLIVMEHYSNFDLPCLQTLLQREGEEGEAIAEQIVAMAGAKLNEENRLVKAFTESFTRIVIYPSRALRAITDPEVYARERTRSKAINMSALREMVRRKNSGHIILVFPAGTRYRADKPESSRGLPEIDSYMKQFDYICPVGIAGNTLLVNPSGDMSEDWPQEDVMVYKAGELIDSRAFRSKAREACPPDAEPKQYVVDRLMDRLSQLHGEVESVRAAALRNG